jgi:hypothetical protein
MTSIRRASAADQTDITTMIRRAKLTSGEQPPADGRAPPITTRARYRDRLGDVLGGTGGGGKSPMTNACQYRHDAVP